MRYYRRRERMGIERAIGRAKRTKAWLRRGRGAAGTLGWLRSLIETALTRVLRSRSNLTKVGRGRGAAYMHEYTCPS